MENISHDSIKSIVIPIIATILCFAIPLFIQVISHIDEKYGSTKLVDRFKKEGLFRGVVIVLIITLILLFYSLNPFDRAIDLGNYNGLIDSSAMLLLLIFTILLIISLFCFALLILKYYSPEKLYKYLSKKLQKTDLSRSSKAESLYEDSIDLALYFVRRDSLDIMDSKLYEILYQFVISYRKDKALQEIIYPRYFYNSIILMNDSLCNQRVKYVSTHNGNDIVKILYDEYQGTYISNETYRVLWTALNQQLYYDKDNLVYEYWAGAHQYIGFFLQKLYEGYKTDFPSVKTIEKKDVEHRDFHRNAFKEFHIALGTLILYKGKFKLLNEIFYYSSQRPPKYHLIPNTLAEILERYIEIRMSYTDPRLFMRYEQSYPFPNIKGADTSDHILYQFERYLALCIVWLYTIESNSYSYKPFLEPATPNGLKAKKIWIEQIDNIKTEVNKILETEKILIINGRLTVECRQTIREEFGHIIDEIRERIERDYVKEKEDIEIDPDTVKEYLESVASLISKNLNQFNYFTKPIDQGNNPSVMQNEVHFNVKQLMKSNMFEADREMAYIGQDSTIATMLTSQVLPVFLRNFSRFNTDEYIIKREELLEALNKLEIPSDYIIISFNIDLHPLDRLENNLSYNEENGTFLFKNRTTIIPLHSYYMDYNKLFILKRTDVPFIEYIDVPKADIEAYRLELLDEKFWLYGSVIKLSKDEELRRIVFESGHRKEEELMISAFVDVEFKMRISHNNNLSKAIVFDVVGPFDTRRITTDINTLNPITTH